MHACSFIVHVEGLEGDEKIYVWEHERKLVAAFAAGNCLFQFFDFILVTLAHKRTGHLCGSATNDNNNKDRERGKCAELPFHRARLINAQLNLSLECTDADSIFSSSRTSLLLLFIFIFTRTHNISIVCEWFCRWVAKRIPIWMKLYVGKKYRSNAK